MSEPIEEAYFNWLCAKVVSPPSFDNYYGLLLTLHKTEFTWVIFEDQNRANNGLELRLDFLRERNYPRESDWLHYPCSVLEMLVAFSFKAEFQTGISYVDWFWKFIQNLGLEDYRRISEDDVPAIQHILQTFLNRTYREDGYGGIFPMRMPNHNQKEVEIWYQFHEYVQDQQLI